jgi:glycosyltransferase involved in cell wall biosynthesis
MLCLEIFHFFVTENNPSGKCICFFLEEFVKKYNIKIHSVECDQSYRKYWERVYSPKRPLFLLFLCYFIQKNLFSLINGDCESRTIKIATEGRYLKADIAYFHFCHSEFMRKHWKKLEGNLLVRSIRKMNHLLHIGVEKRALNNAKVIVVPSFGLKRELIGKYPYYGGKIKVIHNPVDIQKMERPRNFDRKEFRERHGISSYKKILIFVALGDFERKGLSIAIDGIDKCKYKKCCQLLVIGGNRFDIHTYSKKCSERDVDVKFVGYKKDVRPFMWSADAFIFPSAYEVFPLVVLEAAAAELPIIATNVYGVEELVKTGYNGFLIERTAKSVANNIDKFCSLEESRVHQFLVNSKNAVMKFSVAKFQEQWVDTIKSLNNLKSDGDDVTHLPVAGRLV